MLSKIVFSQVFSKKVQKKRINIHTDFGPHLALLNESVLAILLKELCSLLGKVKWLHHMVFHEQVCLSWLSEEKYDLLLSQGKLSPEASDQDVSHFWFSQFQKNSFSFVSNTHYIHDLCLNVKQHITWAIYASQIV